MPTAEIGAAVAMIITPLNALVKKQSRLRSVKPSQFLVSRVPRVPANPSAAHLRATVNAILFWPLSDKQPNELVGIPRR
jgi:hypothetical protein